MKEYIYAEFLFDNLNCTQGLLEIEKLGEDFVRSDSALDYVNETSRGYQRVYGKISSEAATAIKLGNSILASSMRVSYIPDELKNKYRNR